MKGPPVNALLALVAKDFKLFFKDRMAMAFTFAMPLVMIILFGFVFGGAGGGSGPITIIAVDNSQTGLSRTIMRALDSTKTLRVLHTYKVDEAPNAEQMFTDSVAASWVRTGKVTAAFIIPSNAISDTGVGLRLSLLYDARNDMETGLLQGILQQTIMTKVPGMFTTLMKQSASRYLGRALGTEFNTSIQAIVRKYFGGDSTVRTDTLTAPTATAADSGASQFFANLVTIDKQQLVGEKLANPLVTRSIGGWALMFALFSLTAASRTIIEEREEGTLHRLLSSPIPRSTILLGKFLYTWLLGIIQLVILFIIGSVSFSVPIFQNFGNLVVMVILASAAATAFGMLIAAFARTSGQANGISTICILSMSALGGAWFPVSLMPSFIQTISKVTITYWAIDGFLLVLYRNLGIAYLWTNIVILAAIAIVLTSVSIWKFSTKESW